MSMSSHYTKHYYIESDRFVSKIGGGMADIGYRIDDHVYNRDIQNNDDYEVKSYYLFEDGQSMMPRHFDALGVLSDVIPDFDFRIFKKTLDWNDPEYDYMYWYHKDHLGSSTQITDRNETVIHHIEYMPSGEQFSERRDNWATPYKFNGKELDAETGLYYYGARYYTPEIGIWLSVDPLSDERPSLSPYNYCQLNPVMRVDPTGMLDDEFGVTSTGEVKLLKRKSGDHELYKLDNNGKKVDVNGDGKMSEGTDFVKFGRKDVKSAIRFNISIIGDEHRETGRSFGNRADFSNQESAENIFNFITCQKNTDTWKTDVEYSLADLEKGNNRISLLTTGRSSESAIGSRNHVLKNTDKGFRLTRHIHNHPSNNPNPSTGYETGDIDFKNNIKHVGTPNTLYQIKTKHGISNY
jgi:RHS repeat-associated protein